MPPEVVLANPQTPISCTGAGCRPQVKCQLAEDQGIPCSNRIRLFVRRSALRFADEARAPRRIRFASGIANVPPGETAPVRLRLTRVGREIVETSKKRRLPAFFQVRNTPGDLVETRVRIRLRRR